MRTKSKTRKVGHKTKRYARRTGTKLVSIARRIKSKFKSMAKKVPTWTATKATTAAQKRREIQQQIKKVAKSLRTKTLKKIDARLKTLQKQIATRLHVTMTSPKVTSSAIKRLKAKRRQIYNCSIAKRLVKLCKNFKVSSYKNPAYSKKKSHKKTSSYKRTAVKSKKTATYKKQTTKLKKEIRTLKQRNSFMRKQVAKFRKEAVQLQRHYGTLSNKTPRLRLVEKDVSNIVRFSGALTNALTKRAQRKAG